MRLVKKGAEADIYITDWNGQVSVLKIRKKKDYRVSLLDTRIRTLRTVREARMMSEVKSFGIATPLVYFVDEKRCKIYMQFVPGRLVRDLSLKNIVRLCENIGEMVGTLHKNCVMHGDLTTSNFILSKKGLVMLDFGLAQKTGKVDDFAIDLRLFREVLNSAHADIVDDAWISFVKGYQKVMGRATAERVIGQVAAIERRGRYANVV